MNLLGAKLYDPGTAVTKATSALLAMTAIDTTNLRITFTVPAHGMVYVRLTGPLHGAITFPSILLGVMNGATVVGRVAPKQILGNTAVATALVQAEAVFVVTGLTPGSVSWDAAYGVETLVAATGIKYGGPNNTTANDAFGAFTFEVWDPQPIATAGQLTVNASGQVTAASVVAAVVLPTIPTDWLAGAGVKADAVTKIQAGLATPASILTTALTEAYAADGVAPTLSQLLFLVQQLISESSITGGTQTVRKLDGSTSAATFTLSSVSGTESITRAT